MKRLLIYALCIGWAATTVGCSDDDERPVAFEVSQDTLLLDSDAGTVHVIVSAPGAWTITDIPEWVTVVPTEADGSREITIDYSENLDALREADLKVTCNGEFRYIGIGQEGKNLAAAPTNVRLYAKSTSSLTFAWDDTNAARTYTVQCADAPSEDAELMAQYTYTWTTKSTSDKWPYDYPTRMTFLGLMKGGDRSVGSEENLIRPGKTYYFRVRGGGANDEAKWSEWISATPETRTAPAGEIFYEGFDRACVGGGDWLNQAACARTKNDNTQTSIWKLQWDTAVKAAVTTYGNYYTAANFNAEVYKWIGYTRIWDRGTGKGDIQPCPGYTKCGNGSNVGAFRILALGAEKLSAEGDAVTLTFKATPWSEVTTGAGYTMDNKLVDVYVNDAVVAADVRITDSDAAGFRIRTYITGLVGAENVVQAYVPAIHGKEKRKPQPGKEGLLGVEGVDDTIVLQCLRDALGAEAGAAPARPEGRQITYTDLYNWGLSGTPGSAERKYQLLNALGLPPRLSKKELVEALNRLYSFEQLDTLQAEILEAH